MVSTSSRFQRSPWFPPITRRLRCSMRRTQRRKLVMMILRTDYSGHFWSLAPHFTQNPSVFLGGSGRKCLRDLILTWKHWERPMGIAHVVLNPKCQKSELQIEPYSVAEAWGHAVRPWILTCPCRRRKRSSEPSGQCDALWELKQNPVASHLFRGRKRLLHL